MVFGDNCRLPAVALIRRFKRGLDGWTADVPRVSGALSQSRPARLGMDNGLRTVCWAQLDARTETALGRSGVETRRSRGRGKAGAGRPRVVVGAASVRNIVAGGDDGPYYAECRSR